MEPVFAYLAGLLTLLNPCVLPVLPIVLASALQAGRGGPLWLAAGMSVSFVALGLGVTAFGSAIGLDADTLSQAGAWVMLGFGVVLLVPRASAVFATATGGFAARADGALGPPGGAGPGGQLLAGLLLGAVWSPCIGPTLGAAIGLASQGRDLGRAAVIMTGFALGVSTLILALGYGTRGAVMRRRDALRRIAPVARPILGAAFAMVGLSILLGWTHLAEAWALTHLPPWLTDLSVRY